MGDHFGAESVFKKPAVPSRYQRSYSSNRPGSTVSNTSGYSSNTVREKLEVLEKVFPQSDDIWENLVRNIDHLVFVKVSESVLQQSPVSNTNACPSISPQHTTTSSNRRFNYTQSTNNAPDVVSQSNRQNAPVLPRSLYRNSRSRNTCTASAPDRSEETGSRNVVSELQYTSQRLIEQNEMSQGAQNSRSRNQSSQLNNNELTQESNSTLRSDESSALNASEEVVVPPTRKESASNGRAETSSRVNKKRPLSEEAATDGRRKRSKKDDTVEESIRQASSSSVNSKKVVKPTNSRPKKSDLDLIGEFDNENEDSNDSLAAFFQKQRKLTLKKPPSVVHSDSSMSSQNNTVIETKEAKKPLNTRRTKKTSSAQPKESTKPTVVRRQVRASRDQNSNSEDVSAQSQESSYARKSSRTRTTTTRVQTTTRAKKVFTEVRTKQNSPSLEEESEADDRLEVPTRRGSETRKDTRRTVRATVKKAQYKEDTILSDATQSEESTVHEPKNTKKVSNAVKTTRVKSVPSKKPATTVGRTKAAAANQVKKDAAAKKKKTEAPSQAENEIASNSANRMEKSMDASFFGDVSSIIGNASVSMVCLEKEKKTKSRSSHETNTPTHFFSPFASANLRSTSGFSAISTPLSKSMAKNVLGKRVKKPNVGAELRHELKENNKKRRNKKNPPVTQPVHETTATSISDCEISDFSDMD